MKKFKILVGCMVGMLILYSGIYVTMKLIPKSAPKVTSETYPFKMMGFMNKMLELIQAKAAYAEEKDPAYDLLEQGLECVSQQDYEKAIEYFQKVVNDYPESEYAPQALGCIGITLCEKYTFEEPKKEHLVNAIAEWKRLINTYPEAEEAIRAYGAIGSTYGELEDWQTAVTYFEQVLEKYKEKNFSREDIAHAMGALAFAYYFIEKFEESLNLLQKLLTEYSDTEQVKDTEGVLYGALGEVYASLEEPNYEEAIKYLKLGWDIQRGIRDPGVICVTIAEIYHYGLNDRENAKIWYREIVDNYPRSKFYEEAKKGLEELEK